jgi:L-aminopeptidase/D-esterase-like protein
MPTENASLTAVTGVRVGHWADAQAQTGCTVVLCPEGGCVASGMVMGGAPGTREIALLAPEKAVDRVHAVVLAGGSAFGLAAADGVMHYLRERAQGFATPYGTVPIVPSAVIFDLSQGDATAYPDAQSGYLAAADASDAPIASGRVGVGIGAMVGKTQGIALASRGGLGSSCITLRGVKVAALAVSNAFGDIVDPDSGQLVAGCRGNTPVSLEQLTTRFAGENTTLVVVATDAPISKTDAYHLSQSAHIGIARVTRPSHTLHDGDASFVLSTGSGTKVPLMTLSVAVQTVVAQAIIRGVTAAQTV